MRLTLKLTDWIKQFSLMWMGLIKSEDLNRIKRLTFPGWERMLPPDCLHSEASALPGTWTYQSSAWDHTIISPGSRAFRFGLELCQWLPGYPGADYSPEDLGTYQPPYMQFFKINFPIYRYRYRHTYTYLENTHTTYWFCFSIELWLLQLKWNTFHILILALESQLLEKEIAEYIILTNLSVK